MPKQWPLHKIQAVLFPFSFSQNFFPQIKLPVKTMQMCIRDSFYISCYDLDFLFQMIIRNTASCHVRALRLDLQSCKTRTFRLCRKQDRDCLLYTSSSPISHIYFSTNSNGAGPTFNTASWNAFCGLSAPISFIQIFFNSRNSTYPM